MVLFLLPFIQHHGTKNTLNTKTRALFSKNIIRSMHANNSSALKSEEDLGNGSGNSAGVDIDKDVSVLCGQGRMKEALDIVHGMDRRGMAADFSTYAFLLHGCANKKAVVEGKLVHAHIIQTGSKTHDMFLETKVVIMYAKSGDLEYARKAFNEMPERNVVSWTVMIGACARLRHDEEALDLFYQMRRTGIAMDHFAFASVLPACANLAALEVGKEVHQDIARNGYECNVFAGSALVDMYVKCGAIEAARNVFDKIPERNAVLWTVMISAYARNGRGEEALRLLYQMQRTEIQPSQFTYAVVLPACANLCALEHGKEIHQEGMHRMGLFIKPRSSFRKCLSETWSHGLQ